MRKASKKHTYEDWMELVEEIKLAVELSYPMSLFQTTVDICNNIGISYGATVYERREAITNAVFGTGYHIDRNNKVGHLSDLVSLRDVSLDEAADRPCVKFRVHAKLEEGREYLSDETLELLDANSDVVSVNRKLETNVTPIIEACRALDAYATDIEAEIYRQLSDAVKELMLRKMVARRYRNTQYAPLWMLGQKVIDDLIREGVIDAKKQDFILHDRAPGVYACLQHAVGDDGQINGTVFAVIDEKRARCGIVQERNGDVGDIIWVPADNVRKALVEYERLKA